MGSDKKIYTGDLVAEAGKVYEFEEITGYIDARGADTKTAFPKLTTVGGYVYARGADTKTAFPRLTSVGGSVYARGADTKTAFPKLTTVGGYVYASGADTKTAFPKLTTVGGSVDARGADTKTAFPKLTTVGGYVYARGADTKTAFPKLTTVGGSIYARGADTKTAFPKLTTVGGSIDASGDFSHVKTNDQSAAETCRRNIFHANLKIGYYFADGILARLVNRKGHVARVFIVGKTKMSYVVDDGNGNYSHGATLKEARSGLIYKLSSRDTTPFKKWNLKTVVSLADVIKAYRAITGACEAGTRHFCEQVGKLPEKLTIEEAITRTKGQYGSNTFASFFLIGIAMPLETANPPTTVARDTPLDAIVICGCCGRTRVRRLQDAELHYLQGEAHL